MTQTLQTKVETLKLNDVYWDRFTTIMLHKRVNARVVEGFLYNLDARINRKILGSKWNHDNKISRRLLWFAVVEETESNGNHHIHMLSRLMDRERLERFDIHMPKLIKTLWHSSECVIQRNTGDVESEGRRTRAYIRNNDIMHPNFTMHDIEHIISYMMKDGKRFDDRIIDYKNEVKKILHCPMWDSQLAA